MHVQNLMNSLWDIRIFLGLVPKESPCTFQKWPRWLKLWMYPPRRKWFCKRYKAACRFPLLISSDLYRSNKELHSTVLCVAWDPVSSSDRRFIVQSAMYLFQISCHLLAGLLNLKNQKFCRKLIWKKKFWNPRTQSEMQRINTHFNRCWLFDNLRAKKYVLTRTHDAVDWCLERTTPAPIRYLLNLSTYSYIFLWFIRLSLT